MKTVAILGVTIYGLCSIAAFASAVIAIATIAQGQVVSGLVSFGLGVAFSCAHARWAFQVVHGYLDTSRKRTAEGENEALGARTQEEIVARLHKIGIADMFGWRHEVLVCALDFEHAREFLVAAATAEGWIQLDPATEAREYYAFTLGKIRDHRGISVQRSILKLTEYAWLLGRDDVIAAMDAAEHTPYGAPKIRAFAAGLGLTWPDEPDLNRMAAGQPCTPDCREGCGT